MSEINLIFVFKGNKIKIQTNKKELFKDIFKKFRAKIQNNKNSIYFLYNGTTIEEDLTLEKINKKNEEITILAMEFDNDPINEINFGNIKNNIKIKEDNNLKIQSKDIICPICSEICTISIEDYKINVNECEKGHFIKNSSIDEFNESQKIDESKISCICNKKKSEVYNNKFYKCCNCNINLCPLCKSSHNKNHIIIDYESINYICNKHGERYTSYCKKCKKNLCYQCEIEHEKTHDFIYHREIIKNKYDNHEELRTKIKKLKKEINDIIKRLNKFLNIIDIFYNISNNIFSNFKIKNNNYQSLINMNNLFDFNNIIIKDIDNILNEKKIENKIKYIIEKEDERYLRKPFIRVSQYIDYSSKYGLGYILNNGLYGFHYNDCTKIILNPKTNSFFYIPNQKEIKSKDIVLFNFQNYPNEIKKKVKILEMFKKCIDENKNNKDEHMLKDLLKNDDSDYYSDNEIFPYIQSWWKTEKGIIFRLSNHSFQLKFKDNSDIFVNIQIDILCFVNERGINFTFNTNNKINANGYNEMNLKIETFKKILRSLLNEKKNR